MSTTRQRMGRAAGWLPPVLVGLVAFGSARLAMLPDIGFWDTAELQAVAAGTSPHASGWVERSRRCVRTPWS